MLYRTMRLLKKVLLWLVFLTILVVGSFLLYARFSPINLTSAATKILAWAAPETQFTFDELWFSHDGKFTLKAKNVVFEGVENDNIGAIKTLDLRLANRSMALLNPSPKHILIRGIYYEGELRPQEKGANQHQAALVQLEALLSRLKWLKSITIDDVNIILNDTQKETRWALKGGAGKGTYYGEEGLNIKIEGQLAQNDEKLTPAIIQLRTNPKNYASTLNLALSSLSTDWFKPYFPERMQEMLSGQMNMFVSTEWQPKKGWQPIQLSTRLSNISLNIPQGFSEKKQIDTIDIQGAYNIKDESFLLNTFKAKKGETMLSLTGVLKNVTTNPIISASGTATAKHTQDIWPFLPDKKMKRTLPYLAKNVSATLAGVGSIKLEGPLKSIFQCELHGACEQLKLSAKMAAGSWIKPLKNAPRVEASETLDMTWENGLLSFEIPTAIMGNQNLTKVTAHIQHIQTPQETPRGIFVKGTMSGKLESALKVVKPMFNVTSKQMLTGMHKTNITMELPLVRGVSPSIQTASLTVVTHAEQASLLGGIKGKPLLLTNSKFKLQDKRLVGAGKLDYLSKTADYSVDYHMKNKTLVAKLDGKIDVASLFVNMPEALKASGAAPTKLSIKQTQENAPIVFDLMSDLTNINAEVTPLNWQHQTGEKLNLKAQGTWNTKEKALHAELFSLMGNKIEVAGQFYYPAGKPLEAMTVQMSPIVIGNNSFNIEYLDNSLKVSGSSIDVSRLLNQNQDKQQKIEWPEALSAEIDLQRVWFKNGFLQGIDVDLERSGNRWRNAHLNGQMANLVPFNLRYEPSAEGYEMNVRTEDLGMLLSTVGISEKVRGGELLGRLTLDKEHNGSGMITLDNARFINAPVLVQLLSLLSLEELTSGGEGIDFTKGAFPISKTEGSYRLKEAYLTGPSMALKFDGELIPNDKYINIKGQFIPTIGINRAINSIPILGDLLTGSQDGVIVAEFQTKGNWQKPETSVNPLGTITPGIVKDFFRIITGKDKE